MTEKAQELSRWCRYAHVDDTRDDGICYFTLRFRIRDVDMKSVYESLSYDDLCDAAYTVLDAVCPGCEGFDEDWRDADSGAFAMDARVENGFIVMEGGYRT